MILTTIKGLFYPILTQTPNEVLHSNIHSSSLLLRSQRPLCALHFPEITGLSVVISSASLLILLMNFQIGDGVSCRTHPLAAACVWECFLCCVCPVGGSSTLRVCACVYMRAYAWLQLRSCKRRAQYSRLNDPPTVRQWRCAQALILTLLSTHTPKSLFSYRTHPNCSLQRFSDYSTHVACLSSCSEAISTVCCYACWSKA